MTKYKLEYIWLDGYEPVPNLRGKTQVKEFASSPSLEELPLWGFDGSSTRQAEGGNSDCLLKPVAAYPDPARENAVLVMCEVLLPDETPHPSNSRATIPDDPETWFGFEQEYFLYRDGVPLGFPREGFPVPQGEYYTGVGYKNVGDIAREIVDAHLDLCLDAGINHEGINAEVAKGQWEFQIFGKGSKKAADEVWIARYLLVRLCEKYRVDVNFHPKPLGMDYDWNGSGMHANFSTKYLREVGGKEYFEALMAAFDEYKLEHIAVYGPDNHMRLTGLHETQAIDKFNYGVANRGASIRVPHSFVNNGYKGYLEDRRPNSLGDPYQIAGRILETIATVPTAGGAASPRVPAEAMA
jgi:glutamine synthetase